MADAPAPGTHKSGFGFLSNKVGPLPLWVWIAAGIGVWYFLNKGNIAGIGSSSSSQVPNQQTDPAGNIGTIDPATGYVYGTPEDLAALTANNAGTGNGTSTTTPGPGQQTYANNDLWAEAAENYLVSIGVSPTDANQAITLYLGSQELTTQQQAMVNEAIQAIGAPPSLPGPYQPGGGGGNPPPPPPPGGQTVAVPNVVGETAGSAHNAIVAAGLIPTDTQGGVKGEASWKVASTSPPGGTQVTKDSKVAINATKPGSPGPTGKPPTPQNLKLTGNHGTTAQVSWDLPGGYGKDVSWKVVNKSSTGAIVDNFTTNNTIANLGGALAKPPGLKKGSRYTVTITANQSGAASKSLSYTTSRT